MHYFLRRNFFRAVFAYKARKEEKKHACLDVYLFAYFLRARLLEASILQIRTVEQSFCSLSEKEWIC